MEELTIHQEIIKCLKIKQLKEKPGEIVLGSIL